MLLEKKLLYASSALQVEILSFYLFMLLHPVGIILQERYMLVATLSPAYVPFLGGQAAASIHNKQTPTY